MCLVLELPRSTYYYCLEKDLGRQQDLYTQIVIDVFHSSRKNYGTRKIKDELSKRNIYYQDVELEES